MRQNSMKKVKNTTKTADNQEVKGRIITGTLAPHAWELRPVSGRKKRKEQRLMLIKRLHPDWQAKMFGGQS